jgi:hypothetical protein
MDVSFATGYITHRLRERFGGSSPHPATGAPAAISAANPQRHR